MSVFFERTIHFFKKIIQIEADVYLKQRLRYIVNVFWYVYAGT